MSLPPIVEDLGPDEDDTEFIRDPHDEEGGDIPFEDPEEEENEDVEEDDEDDFDEGDDDDDDDDDDDVQVVTRSRPKASRSTPGGDIPFDPEIHDITGYEKVDIIRFRNKAFNGDARYAKRVKGVLLGQPVGSIPTVQQINSSELFALCVPQKGKSENDDEDE